MNIRTGTELIIHTDGYETPFKSFFIGGKANVSIVAGFPQQLSFPKEVLHKGVEVIVQYLEGECIYEFKTRILDVLKEPTDLIILEYPAETRTVEQRSHKRINCLVAARFEIRFEDNNQLAIGVIENISKTGCSCKIKKFKGIEKPLSMGDIILMKCQFPGFAGEQRAEGQIIRLQESQEEINAGIRFDQELWWIPPYGANRQGASGLE
jgi:c-di-GMP-binding flagellar brake protein YcgR